MKMMKTLMLLATVLLGACAGAATPETATGSSAYFHVNTSNDTVRITDVWSKFFEGEYGKGKGRNATFLNGISVEMDLTIYTENAKNEEDPIDHCEIVSTGERIEMVDQELAQFRINVGEFEIGEKLEIKAVTREGSESKPFRVNFDIAKIPDCFAHEPAASVEDDRVLYTQLEAGSYWFFQSMDGALKLKNLINGSGAIDGLKFNWYPQIHLGVAMDSSTAKVLVGTLSGLGGKAVGNISKDNWKKFGKQKIGRLAGVDLHVNLEGDIIGKWNPEKKIWVNVESVIGADIVYSGQVSFRFPQTLYLVYVSGGLSGETHCLISPRSDDQWKLTSNILGQPLIEGFVEGGAGIDGFKIAAGGELGLILHSQNPDLSDWTKGLQDWGWGGQLYWTAQFLGKTWGSQGVRQDETSIDEASYYFQYWWWHNGVHADSWSSDEAADAAVQAASGPTKANAAKLMAARPRLMAAAEPDPCNPQPARAMRGGVDALLYLTNAPARAASDQSTLVCRMGADGAWGAVETPWDDGTADLSPSVGVADDGTVVAAWVNMKGQVGEPTQLTDVTRQMEIAVGVRNPSTGVWTCRNLTADDQVDFSPRVAVAADGTAYVAWCANSDNAFYGSNTVVKCVKFADGAWGSVVSLGKVGSVNGLAVACRDAKGAIACTVEDGAVRQVRCFEVADGSVVQSATVVGTSWVENPDVFYSVDGVARFHWIQEGELRTKSGFAAGGDAVAEGAAGVTMPHGAAYLKGPDGVQGLVWQEAPKANGEQNGVMLMAHDVSGKWQVPATLWIPEERNGAFSGGYAADGTLRLAYESASGSRDAQGVMRYGAATLKTFELGGGVDVSVTANEIGVDGERVFFGEENDFVATIHNLGRTDAVNVPVKCVAVANGATNEFFSTLTDIVSGGCVCLTSKWTVAMGCADLVFRVLVDPEETLADANRANNVAEWRPEAGALAIVDERSVRETRTVCQVNAKVVTDGALVIPEGTVVEYRRGGVDGELLATDTLGEVVPGKGYSTGFRWDMSTTTFTRAWETVYLKIRGNDHAIAAVDVVTTLDTDGDGVFDGEEGLLGSDPNDPESKPDAWDDGGHDKPEPSGLVTFRFDSDGLTADENGTVTVRIAGGNLERTSSVKVYLKYTGASSSDLDLKKSQVDGKTAKKVTFPVTLKWAAGEVGEKTIVLKLKKDSLAEGPETLTLQLGDALGLTLGEARTATVSIGDASANPLKATVKNPSKTKGVKKYDVTVASADEAAGLVSPGGSWYKGAKVTVKAKAKTGYVFSAWYDTATGRKLSTSANYTFTVSKAVTLEARFSKRYYVRALADPADGATVSGSGWYAKNKTATLKTKAKSHFKFLGWYAAKADDPNAPDMTKKLSGSTTFKPKVTGDLGVFACYKSDPRLEIFKTSGGSVSGASKYAKGKTATLKAKVSKGYAFLGWYDANGNRVSQAMSYKYKMGAENVVFTAQFKKESALAAPILDWNAATEFPVGVSYSAKPKVSCEAAVKIVKVTGLPAGLSYKSGKVSGAPTAVKTYTVSVTVALATNSKKTWTLKQKLVVTALPAWAKGTFNGGSETTPMQATLTIGSTGKVSGKLCFANAVWTLSGTHYTKLDPEAKTATLSLTAKKGTTKKTVMVTVVCKDQLQGFAFSETKGFAFEAQQNLWKSDHADIAAELALRENLQVADGLVLRFGANGAVTGVLTVGKNAFTCTTTLVPEGDVYRAYLYFAPNATKKFRGAVRIVDIESAQADEGSKN